MKRLSIVLVIVLLAASLLGLSSLANGSEPSVEIAYYTVPMTTTVEILYAVPSAGYDINPDGTVDGLSLLVWKGAEGSVADAEEIRSRGVMNVNGTDCLIFRYDGLEAHEMGVKVYAKASYGERLGSTKSYSVKDFAASYDGKHKALVSALIKYGNAIEALANEARDAEAEIVNKNGAKGVLTLISDDGDQRTSDFFYTEIVPAYNSFKITIALPTKKVASLSKTADGKAWLMNEDGDYVLTVLPNEYTSKIDGSVFASNNYSTMVDFWKKITDTGAIELASHSHTHDAWGVTDEYNAPYPAGNVIKELHASAQILRDLLGQESHFILRPGGHTDLTSAYFYNLVETDDTFIGMRSSNGAPPLPGATSANGAKLNTVEKFQNADGRLKIATILVRGYEAAFNEAGTGFATASGASSADCIEAGISAWTQYVDYAIQYGSWASIGFHSVVSDSTATASGYAVFDSQVKALMDYVEPLAESGELWLASFSDAAKYYFEWSSATVSATTYGDERVEVTLTDREEDERFDEPLTVKVTVPDGWKKAELESYGVTTELTVHTAEDGTRFVYANILPGEGVSTVRGK